MHGSEGTRDKGWSSGKPTFAPCLCWLLAV